MKATYHPISCEFHDLLEAHATTRRPTKISFFGDDGAHEQRSATITDVFSRNSVEYLVTSTGETVRLDRLVAIGDARLADYSKG
jgi:Rho-binding antiterminator